MKRSRLLTASLLAFVLISSQFCSKEVHELRLLCWIGYDESDFIQLVEARTGIKVRAKTFVGGDQMFSTLQQSPKSYDVVVVDPEYVAKLISAASIEALPEKEFSFSDYFPSLRHFPLSYDESGSLYAVLVRFGVNGLLYNTRYLTQDEVKSYKILWDNKLRGRILIFDWYLPNMGVFSRIAGNTAYPYNINQASFEKVEALMKSLRPSIKAIQSSFSEMISALANEEAWVQPTAGESLAYTLRNMNKPIDWTVPDEGGIMWCETLAIVRGTRNRDLALKYIKFMQTPEAQAALVRRKAYVGSVPNSKAYQLLTQEEMDILKIHSIEEAEELLSRLSVRVLPSQQKESDWQSIWQNFKARQ